MKNRDYLRIVNINYDVTYLSRILIPRIYSQYKMGELTKNFLTYDNVLTRCFSLKKKKRSLKRYQIGRRAPW